jgi:hypothetical protein
MIQKPIPLRDEFKEKVNFFCYMKNIQWGVVYEGYLNEGVIGTPQQIEQVEDYILLLEKERKEFRNNKKIWWRLKISDKIKNLWEI